MSYYSIKDMEKLSGIKAHTIRIWEQRYGILEPQRTPTNIRYYDDDNLKDLLKIALLNQNGFKISKISLMSPVEIKQKYAELVNESNRRNPLISALISATVSMDEAEFNEVIRTGVDKIGFRKTVIEVVYPFLERLGILWLRGSVNPAQEHFASSLIRQKILVAIDRLNEDSSLTKDYHKTCVMFLPEKETHELSLLFTHYLMKVNGFKVVYLGANVELEHLKYVLENKKVDWLLTIFTTQPTRNKLDRYVSELAKLGADQRIFIAGQNPKLKHISDIPENVKILNDLGDFQNILQMQKLAGLQSSNGGRESMSVAAE